MERGLNYFPTEKTAVNVNLLSTLGGTPEPALVQLPTRHSRGCYPSCPSKQAGDTGGSRALCSGRKEEETERCRI